MKGKSREERQDEANDTEPDRPDAGLVKWWNQHLSEMM